MRTDPRKRYSQTDHFEYDEGEQVLFRGLKPRTIEPKSAYIEHELKVGERLDSLAENYYGDPRLWWVIAQANPQFLFGADLVYLPADDERHAKFRAGHKIVIPAKPGGAT